MFYSCGCKILSFHETKNTCESFLSSSVKRNILNFNTTQYPASHVDWCHYDFTNYRNKIGPVLSIFGITTYLFINTNNN